MSLLLGAGLLIFSCSKKNTSETTVKPDFDSTSVNDSTAITEEIKTSCFMNISGKDTLLLSYEDNLGTVTGKLQYRNFQKDSSLGDIAGLMTGDTLKVTYTFESEGKTSNREIWFLKKDGEILEGIGNYDTSGENYDAKTVKFEKGRTLKPADCKLLDKQ